MVAFLHPPVTSPRQARDEDKVSPKTAAQPGKLCCFFLLKDKGEILENCNPNYAIVSEFLVLYFTSGIVVGSQSFP